jgi:hypothetical protein
MGHAGKLVAVAVAALVLAGTAAAAPPRTGVLVPGRSLGGISLGMTQAQVSAAWGPRHGVCRDCGARTTWYFNRERFRPQGAGVELRDGRVVSVFTLWRPPGWRTSDGLVLGEPEARITETYDALTRVECGGYSALMLRRAGTVTAFYVYEGRLWGFGLTRPDALVCR